MSKIRAANHSALRQILGGETGDNENHDDKETKAARIILENRTVRYILH